MNDIVKLDVNGQMITGNDILSAIDHVIDDLNKTNDLELAERALKSLKGIEDVSGMGIAKLLHGVNTWWDATNQDDITGDTFEDWAYDVDTSFKPVYIKRCVAIYKYEADGTFSERIQNQPIKYKQQIAMHLDMGYDISKDEWKMLERSTHESETGAILREIKGKPPRKQSLQISLDRDGSIRLWYQDESFFGGYLSKPEGAESTKEREAIEKMISRFEKTGMVVK